MQSLLPSSTSSLPTASLSTTDIADLPSSAQLSRQTITVADWAAVKKPHPSSHTCRSNDDEDNEWQNVYRNIKRMDQLYDATFYSWLKSEDNVLVTAMYLHRIANEYPLERIINALKWLINDWRWESTSILVRHVTVDWCDEAGDYRRAELLRHLTHNWATQYTATLITTILAASPYQTAENEQRERFIRAFTKNWDFSKLSEFFMYLQSRANIDYKVKCVMLQEVARKERETLSAKMRRRRGKQAEHDVTLTDDMAHPLPIQKGESSRSVDENDASARCLAEPTASGGVETSDHLQYGEDASSRRHHRRISSNTITDTKRLRLSAPLKESEEITDGESSSSSSSNSSNSTARTSDAPVPISSTSTITHQSPTNNRRATTFDHPHHHSHHHHHHHLRSTTSVTDADLSLRNSNATTGATNVSDDLAHLHIDIASGSNANLSPNPSSSNPFVNARHHHCYPYSSSSSSSHLHTTMHLRRRSSSTASSSSSSSDHTLDETPDTSTSSNLRKRGGTTLSSNVSRHLADE
ncbi:uncharacterized protein BYT42DRAFT_617593 [Radiomyces spectabilis]|uniref:uncharacterized protein n=1 Tax=Radiomyces spectabilis TaxID=64574 RepID=UPI00221E3C56|nr:uncharacterized protein BYT42DRAFT_617593 [Radiomyces spectabilis]KAI8369588.1 hypothetical protein BYT42DRAFT_617593 [Radiomyces spectabilis]